MSGNDGSTGEQPVPLEARKTTQTQHPRQTMDERTLHLTGDDHDPQDSKTPAEPPSEALEPATEPHGSGMLDRSLQAKLGSQLRAIYSDVANEPVPERFVRLLEELEAREKPR